MKRILSLQLALLILLLSCVTIIYHQKSVQASQSSFQSYKDIPGVTQQEIDEIEALRQAKREFIYGVSVTTEAFLLEDGSIGGFSALFINRMAELFGFDFTVRPYVWNDLVDGIVSTDIDFTGEFTATPERLKIYYMTDPPIVQRSIKLFADSKTDLREISKERPVKIAYLDGSTLLSIINATFDLPFEPVPIDDEFLVPELILNGEIDAFIEESVFEACFDTHDFIKAREYYPLTYSPVSLTTGNPELKPFIEVMQKYLKNGGYDELIELYNQGYSDYLKHKLSIHLTEEEKAYIRSHSSPETAVSVAYDAVNYPTSFFNSKEKEFQGVAYDLLEQISSLTGLVFKAGTTKDTIWPELLDGLETGKYAVTTELLQTAQRKGRFLWTDEPYYTDYYALISRADYPDIDINRIPLVKVGLLEDTAYTDVFLDWFPNNDKTVLYPDRIEACNALENGEIDLLMGSQSFLLHLTNYLERPNFKTNIVFDYSAGSFFGFNKDEELLCSIINKAQGYVDAKGIAESWQRKVFDYQGKMLRDMVPYAAAVSIILIATLFVVFVLLIKNRRINKNLDKTVSQRTRELERRLEQQRLMADLSQNFITGRDIDEQITESLRMIGEFLGISRVLLMKFEKPSLHYLYEWHNPSHKVESKLGLVLPVSDMEKHLLVAYSERTISRFSLDDTDRQDFMARYNLKDIENFIMLPIYIGDVFWGVLEFDQCEAYTPWTPSDIDLGEIVAGILSGVMARRKMEEELLHLSAIVENSPQFITTVRAGGEFAYFNPAAVEISGYTVEELNEGGLSLLMDGEHYRRLKEEIVPQVVKNKKHTYELPFITKSGEMRIMSVSAFSLKSDADVICSIASDITELIRMQSELAEAVLKIEMVVKNYDGVIWSVDKDRIVTLFNGLYLSKIGVTPSFLEGKSIYLAKEKNMHLDIIDMVERTFESGPQDCISEIDGNIYKSHTTPVRDKDGNVISIVGDTVEVTEMIRLQNELQEAIRVAESASKAKGDFLSRMSHEIRTPLNAVIGMINIAMGTEDNSKIQNCLIKADNASKHLLGVINDILDMSKIEADKFELDRREFSFEKMLMNVANVTNFRAEEKKQNFIVNLNGNVPETIVGDDLRLSQVFTNLLTNAVKFTPEHGTVILNIDKIEDNGESVTLRAEVVDNGIGISEEQQKRLFTSFEQADGGIARRFGGTGLGLAISKRIVELMGGSIWIESELDKGSKFIFTMKADKGSKKARTKLSERINKDDMRILAVDDSPEIREYFIHVMASLGLPCDVAGGGVEALEMVKNCGGKPYNIFFIDWQMPEMNGIELTKRIKETAPNNSVVFMISVAEWGMMEKEALAAGVRSFISKPLFPSTLVNAINECMEIVPQSKQETADEVSDDRKLRDFSRHKILIAEDIEINREIMSALLEETGVEIDYAENGIVAVSTFTANPGKYSLILMDIHMPEMDGYEATRRIRGLKLPQSKNVPIIAMTANVFREDIENCLAAGMNNHIGKPVDQEDMFAKLELYLQ